MSLFELKTTSYSTTIHLHYTDYTYHILPLPLHHTYTYTTLTLHYTTSPPSKGNRYTTPHLHHTYTSPPSAGISYTTPTLHIHHPYTTPTPHLHYTYTSPTLHSGIRYTMTADPSSLDHMMLDKAGLFDTTLGVYVPALTIDYNRHSIVDSMVFFNMADGLEIRHNEIMGFASFWFRGSNSWHIYLSH